jgi:predicted amidohydrolase
MYASVCIVSSPDRDRSKYSPVAHCLLQQTHTLVVAEFSCQVGMRFRRLQTSCPSGQMRWSLATQLRASVEKRGYTDPYIDAKEGPQQRPGGHSRRYPPAWWEMREPLDTNVDLENPMSETTRIAAAQTANRTIPFRVGGPAEALIKVEQNIEALVALANRAADEGCDIVAFPEDCLGPLEWEAGHWKEVDDLLLPAGEMLQDRFAAVARERHMAIVYCNDLLGTSVTDSTPVPVYNTAVLLGSDGTELGRYRKVQPTLSERHRALGDAFPVFDVPAIGPVGMCICYDMVFPETTRALALGGADLVFHCTMGGASFGDGDASLAAFRTRAADNFIYLVVSFRGGGSMIIGPKGQILAEAEGGGDCIVAADVDLTSGREAGDSLGGMTKDFRARLFRERNPAAYRILTDEHPPALTRLRHVEVPSEAEAAALFAEAITTGTERFYEAERLQKAGEMAAAREIFADLGARFGTLWMGTVARQRLAELDG